jgi:hypothetical protein
LDDWQMRDSSLFAHFIIRTLMSVVSVGLDSASAHSHFPHRSLR